MIVGSVRDGSPFVKFQVVVPRLGRQAEVEAVVDTGSHSSLLNPEALTNLGVVISRDFAAHRRTSSRGLGGRHSYFLDICEVFLLNEAGLFDRLTLPLRFAVPSAANTGLPSLIGLDILRNYRMVFEPAAGLITLDARVDR